MCAVAGIIMLARFNSVRVGHGESYLLITVLACFLGGVDPFGGFGRVISVFLALSSCSCCRRGSICSAPTSTSPPPSGASC